MMTNRRLGGADHRLATGGVGSSPTGSTLSIQIRYIRKKILRKQLKKLDKKLAYWDKYLSSTAIVNYKKLDKDRCLIRNELKGYNDDNESV